MIQYLNKKDIYGPFHTRGSVYLPHSAEVCSDKSSAKHNLDDFLKNAYSKQIKELNGTTAAVHFNQLHDAEAGKPGRPLSTPFSDRQLLGDFARADRTRKSYLRDLGLIQAQEERRDREEYGEDFVQLIRQRNRLARIRDACHDMVVGKEDDYPRFNGGADDYLEAIHPDILAETAHPLSSDLQDRIHAAR